MTGLGCCIPRFESSLYNLSLVLFYMEGFLHFLGWPEAYFEETTDAQGEGLRRIVDGVKFRRRSRWNRMQIRIRHAFLLQGSVLLLRSYSSTVPSWHRFLLSPLTDVGYRQSGAGTRSQQQPVTAILLRRGEAVR